MKKSFAVFAAVLIFACVAAAQDTPRIETFLGYTYTRTNTATNVPAFNANGGSGQFAYNFNRYLSAVADLGAVHNGNIGGAQIDNTTANFLFGPRLSMRYARLRPYFQVLWGGAVITASSKVNAIVASPTGVIGPGNNLIPGDPITARIGADQTAFAMTAGGGLDIKLNKHVSFRPIGVEYYLTRFQNLRSQNDNNQNNIRYTAGLNFTFGAQ
jgi:opacity protein-like surface antigen